MATGTLERPIQITHEHPAKGKASVVLRYTSKKHHFSSIRLVVKGVVEKPKFILDLGLVRFESNVRLPKRSVLVNEPAEIYAPLADLIAKSKPLIAPRTTTLLPPSANGVHRNGGSILQAESASTQEPKPTASEQEGPPKTVSIGGSSFEAVVEKNQIKNYNHFY